MQKYRLPKLPQQLGKKIVNFTFDGRPYTGYAGDSLASALIANGVRVQARSFKYHRPRGVMTAGSEEPNALVTLFKGERQQPNMVATMIPLYDGLEAYGQNAFPSVNFDMMAINNLLSPIFVAGFYYKTFMGLGQKGWHFFEHFIRKAAGQGHASNAIGTEKYDQKYGFCDVLIVGGGVSGISAALSAGRAGKRVMIIDEHESMGGYAKVDTSQIDGQPSPQWVQSAVQELQGLANVTVMPRATATGLYDNNTVPIVERLADHFVNTDPHQVRQRLHQIHADKIIMATGSTERPLVFAGNDLPNIMTAEALHIYINHYGVCPGDKVVIFTNNDSAYRTAHSLLAVKKLVTVIDTRETNQNPYAQSIIERGGVVIGNAYIHSVKGNKKQLQSVTAIHKNTQTKRTIPCDVVASSGGHTPIVHLWSHICGKPVYDENICAFVPHTMPSGMTAVGACVGEYDLQTCMEQGYQAGVNKTPKTKIPKVTETGFATTHQTLIEPLWEVPDDFSSGQKKFVDMQHDVTSDDVKLSHREGYRSVEHLKRYTTLGMANDQGKTSNVNALAQMAVLQNQSIGDTGTTVFRPPYTPVTLGALGGVHSGFYVQPVRLSPFHDAMVHYGAKNTESGLWYRPEYFPETESESLQEGYVREMQHVRTKVGLCDVGTVGKIDVQGPDAGEFLNRLYTNMFATLPVGKCRYGMMLREDGIVDDDGTAARISEHHYLVTTTTAHAAEVLYNMEKYLQTEWTDLKVTVTSVSDQTGTLALAGPRSRDVLNKITGQNLDNEKLPMMGMVYANIGGIPVRIVRLSFSGEMAFEIFADCGYCTQLYHTIMEAGAEFEIAPYGLEALGGLRIEKGFVTHAEINGTITAKEVGMAGLLSKKKWFIGKDMLEREGLQTPQYEMVGVIGIDKNAPVTMGGHIVASNRFIVDDEDLGYITSSTYSVVHHTNIGLAMVKDGRSRMGETLYVSDPLRGNHFPVQIVDPVFYDKEGEATHG